MALTVFLKIKKVSPKNEDNLLALITIYKTLAIVRQGKNIFKAKTCLSIQVDLKLNTKVEGQTSHCLFR